ncbi:hypothetical protein BDFB_006843, partial [Asbolus verrucosus]
MFRVNISINYWYRNTGNQFFNNPRSSCLLLPLLLSITGQIFYWSWTRMSLVFHTTNGG